MERGNLIVNDRLPLQRRCSKFKIDRYSEPMLINTALLDSVSEQARNNKRLRMNFNFHSSPEAKSQRLLNAIEMGSVIPVHRHTHTAETYILLRGIMRVFFHNEEGEVIESFDLDPLKGNYGIDIPQGQWHSLEVISSDTVIFEVKDGPYEQLSAEDILHI
jgi:cupin fold WbuC family metalloprotein